MRRRTFLKQAAAGVATTAIATPAVAQTPAQVRWRMTTSWPKSLDTIYGSAVAMCQRIGQLTDGKFQISAFAGGEIVPATQAFDAVSKNSVECGHTLTAFYFGKNPVYAFDSGVAFGANSRQQAAWLYYGGGMEVLREIFRREDLINFPCGNTGVQMGGWFRKEIKSVDDLRGLKMRIGGFAGTILAKLGLVPQQLAAGDIYPALEKGTLEACEWVGPHDDEKLGFYKVARYYYYPGWWEGCGQAHNLINLAKWNELPKAYQSAIQTASGDAWEWVIGKYDYANPAALKRLLAQGVQLRAFPQDVMEASYKAALDIYAELSNTNPMFKKLYDSLVAYRGDSLVWLQVAELSFDSFMMRMRTRT